MSARIIIQTLGSAGDVHPHVGIGRALAARGHDVHVIACEAFERTVRDAGLTFVECGSTEQFEVAMRDPNLWHPQRGLGVIADRAVAPSLRPAYESIVERIEPGRTVLLAGTLAWSAMVAAETHDVPLAVAHLAPSAFRTVYDTPRYPGVAMPGWMPHFLKHGAFRLIDLIADHIVTPPLDTFRRELGLAPVRRIFGEWVLRADALLAMFPEWFAARQPDWPERLHIAGFPRWDDGDTVTLEPELDAWLRDGPPPIVFTAGSAHMFGGEFFRESAAAADALGRRAALVTQNPDVIPEGLSRDIRHVAYAPFSRLFARASAVVHHGGIGTTAQALAAGVPALAAPMGFDQFDNGHRLVKLGVGAVVPMRKYERRRVASALRGLLDDGATSDSARELATRFAGIDACAAAAVAIESLAESHGRSDHRPERP